MDTTALFKLSYGLYVVGVQAENKFGGCIVDAVVQIEAGSKPVIMVSSGTNNLTNALIKKTGEFTLSVLGANVDPFVVANFGFQSARDADKWANVPYTLKNGLPVLNQAIAHLHCKLIEVTKELATHTMFLAEVVDAEKTGDTAKPLLYNDYQTDMKAASLEAFKKFKETGTVPVAASAKAQWRCSICGYVYDGEIPFEDLPPDWACPLCGVGKDMFEKV
jgi:flavin reductase (DIM6/NTAB) family NADH-FMN oxidoreductase RutF/rubredoxin